MNQETKVKMLDMLHELPLTAIKAQAEKYQGTADGHFWNSIYNLEKQQRSRKVPC